MKKFLLLSAVVLIAALAALYWSFLPQALPVPVEDALVLPQANPPPQMRLSVLHTGQMYSRAALSYRGGAFDEERIFGMDVILVEHPQGRLLFDSGFGRDVDAQFRDTPWLMQATSTYDRAAPVVDQLAAAGMQPSDLTAIVLTHAHWDHVSGLPDLAGVPVWLPQAELAFVQGGDPHAALARSYSGINWQPYTFDGGPYLGFPASRDVFGDGSVVLVPAGGHTPGSTIAFLTLPGGQQYALVGDLVWQKEGVEIPAERPWLPRTMVDVDPAALRWVIPHLHRLQQMMPRLIVVPAHDRRVTERLPAFERRAPA